MLKVERGGGESRLRARLLRLGLLRVGGQLGGVVRWFEGGPGGGLEGLGALEGGALLRLGLGGVEGAVGGVAGVGRRWEGGAGDASWLEGWKGGPGRRWDVCRLCVG